MLKPLLLVVLIPALALSQHLTLLGVGTTAGTATETVTAIGSATACNFASSCAQSVTSGVSAGHLVVVVTETNVTGSTFLNSVTDSATPSNTYTCIQTDDGFEQVNACYAYMANAIPSSGTITASLANNSNGIVMRAYNVSSGHSAGTLDTSTNPAGSSTLTPSVTTGSNLTATDTVFVVTLYNGGTFSAYGGGYTGLDSAINGNGYGFSLMTEWKTQTSGSTATGGFTLTGSNNICDTILLALKQ